MKKASIIFLQIIVVLIAVGALAFMFYEPQIEGRNINASFFEIYFKDLFLAYVYIASISFFTVLYQTFKTLEYVKKDKIFSPEAVKAVRTIKHAAIAMIGFVFIGEIFIMLNTSDDRAGGVFMGLLIGTISVIITAAAYMFESVLQKVLNIKTNNNITS